MLQYKSKNDAEIPKCVCRRIGRLLPRTGRFLPKKWKASSKEHWVCTHEFLKRGADSLMDLLELCVCLPELHW